MGLHEVGSQCVANTFHARLSLAIALVDHIGSHPTKLTEHRCICVVEIPCLATHIFMAEAGENDAPLQGKRDKFLEFWPWVDIQMAMI